MPVAEIGGDFRCVGRIEAATNFAHAKARRPAVVGRNRKRSAIGFGAFFLNVNGVGVFSSKGAPKIIWIGVGKAHPHLFQIHKRVQEAALAVGIEPELRPWHPHITIARCRGVSAQALRKFLQSNAEFDTGMIRVDAFHLYSSNLTPAGPIHTRELTVHCSGRL